ncbi:MAG TPA: glycosyltransferase family 2 protein [Thermosynechococcaceae cyanobacterium]
MNLWLILLSVVLLLGALALLIPIGVLWVECTAALLPTRRSQGGGIRPTIAILVPAHNEASGIQATLKTLLPQLSKDDRLVVVADNCEDETAAISREAGATVIERHDLDQRGKGYALDFGLRFLSAQPPDVVVIVDADCLVSPGSIEKIAVMAIAQKRPVQATYLLTRPARPSPKDAVSVLAFTVKNLVRPLGLRQLGLPNLLTGTGMALPWSLLSTVSLASSNLVEDMQMALDFALAGHPPTFCAEARVIGALPQQKKAAKTQRTRWEHGHLQTLKAQVPRLTKAALRQKRFDLLSLALDLSVPPLSLLVMLWLVVSMIALVAFFWLKISPLPVLLLALEGGLLLVAILTAWARFCRAELPLHTLLSIPLYVLWKVPLYLSFLIKPQTKWVRTERDAAPKS